LAFDPIVTTLLPIAGGPAPRSDRLGVLGPGEQRNRYRKIPISVPLLVRPLSFAAVDGLRLVIGVGSLAVSVGIGTAMDRFHQDWIRVPVMVLALLGSSLNLKILMQIRHLRNRPASRWRQRPLSPSRIRMERVQMALSLATLVLIGVEEYLHLRWCNHL
jgi:hypothetical protein